MTAASPNVVFDCNVFVQALISPAAAQTRPPTPTPVPSDSSTGSINGLAKERFSQIGIEPAGGTPEQAAKFLDAEIAKWAKVITTAGVKAEQ